MTKLLLKIFIKDSENVSSPSVRKKYGALSGGIGIFINIILFIMKLFAGIFTSSISVMADAFNNLSDAGSSIVTLVGFKMAEKPADNDHPYGHGRVEYITGLIIAFIILIMGLELLKSSVQKIINPEDVQLTTVSLIILIVSIAAKLWLSVFNRKLGKNINSSAMFAVASDSLNDSVATTVVLISLIIKHFFDMNIDGYAGVIVALFVMRSGYETAKDTLQPLLGKSPDPEFVKNIEDCILSNKKILGIHDMIVHDYGPGQTIISLHAEIPCDIDIMEAHDIIDSAEEKVKNKFNCEITIHMDPIAVNDEFVIDLKEKVFDIISSVDKSIGFHDFRVKKGSVKTNVIFDIEIPFDFMYTDIEIIDIITKKIVEKDEKLCPIIHIDKKVV